MHVIRLTEEQLDMLDRKAPHGTACTSCGLCCSVHLCDMGAAVFNRPKSAPGPCPALEWTDGKSGCGLLTNPTKYTDRAKAVGHEAAVAAAAILIDPGFGCDMGLQGDFNAGYKATRDVVDALPMRQERITWAFRIFGISAWAKRFGLRGFNRGAGK